MATSSKKHSAAQYEAGTVVQVAPANVLIERNIRDAQPDAGLVKSVKSVGILEPVVAVLTDDNKLLVRRGHRRTLAAIEAGLDTIPVYISGADASTDEAEIGRIIEQRDENTHRVGLTTAEEVGIVGQLTAFGLSPAQVAKKARITRANVDAALAVGSSELASKAAERYDQLTLDQAAVVAEFEDDTETVKALIAAASTGQFDHVAQRARDDRAERDAIATITATLTEEGLTVVERPGWDSPTVPSHRLRTTDRQPITEAEHRQCPGHVVWPAHDWQCVTSDGTPIGDDEYDQMDEEAAESCQQIRVWGHEWGCTDPKTHGHLDAHSNAYYGSASSKPKAEDMSDEEREATRAARALVVENNKAWSSAQPVRRDWLAQLAKAKTPPKGTAKFLTTALSVDAQIFGERAGVELAAEWLGKPSPSGYARADLSAPKSATDNRALLIALVQVLAYHEATIAASDRARGTWRRDNTDTAAGRYLRFLQGAGYTLAEVEKYAISAETA